MRMASSGIHGKGGEKKGEAGTKVNGPRVGGYEGKNTRRNAVDWDSHSWKAGNTISALLRLERRGRGIHGKKIGTGGIA